MVVGKALSRSNHSRTLSRNQLRAYQVSDSFIPLKLPIKDIFEAIKSQPWVRRQDAKTHDPFVPERKTTVHSDKGHRTSQCRSLCKYLEDLVQEGYLREYILTPGTSSETERQQDTSPPNQPQHTVTQYRTIDCPEIKTGKFLKQIRVPYISFHLLLCIFKSFNKNTFLTVSRHPSKGPRNLLIGSSSASLQAFFS